MTAVAGEDGAGARPVAILTPTDPAPVAAALMGVEGICPVVVRSLAELVPHLPDAEGLVIGSYLYRDAFEAIVREAKALKWVQLSASGYEIYQEIGAPDGVQVMRATGVWGRSVAGHALALLLALMRRLPDVERARQERRWARAEMQPVLASLPGRRVLLVGYGDIGATLAPVLRGLGAEVTIVARRARANSPDGPVHGVSGIDALLDTAEMLVLTVPSSADTVGLLGRERLARLPKGALVVNVGRGEVLDETALAELLASRHLGGAGLDVFTAEPLPADSLLWDCPNVILSPHTAAFGDRDSLTRLGELTARNARLIAAGQTPVGLVGVGNSGKVSEQGRRHS